MNTPVVVDILDKPDTVDILDKPDTVDILDTLDTLARFISIYEIISSIIFCQ